MKTTTRIIISLLVLIVVIGTGFALWYVINRYTSDKAHEETTNISANTVELVVAVSPDGSHLAKLHSNVSANTQYLDLVSSSGKLIKTLLAKPTSDTMLHPLWSSKGNRLYFGYVYGQQKPQTTLSYIDLNDPDPTTVTEIVYADPQQVVTYGQTNIVGENGNILYVQNGNHIYTLDISQGINAEPVLQTEL